MICGYFIRHENRISYNRCILLNKLELLIKKAMRQVVKVLSAQVEYKNQSSPCITV